MRPQKIDRKVLFNMLRQGRTKTQCAAHFGTTVSAVTQASKGMNLAIAKNVQMETANAIVCENLDAMAQLKAANDQTNAIIDLLSKWVAGDPAAIKALEKHHRLGRIGTKKGAVNALAFKDPKELLLKYLQEVRQQVRLSFDIAQALTNMQQIEEFQRTVIETISEASPEVRNEIVRKLQHKRAIRGAVRIS